jgi:carbonic anhydrase/acetyltransferase-like protein (isoleucine patch superfamily)
MSTAPEAEKQPRKMPTPEELEAMMVVPAVLVTGGVFVLQLLIYGLPIVAIALPLLYSPALGFTIVWLLCAPLLYAFLFATTAGLLSRPFQAGIIKGVFPRDVRFPIYAMRRLYGICWTSLYYFKPIYGIVLSIPTFKTITFRLFGYKGSMNFSVAPDTWIRDLPLLKIEDGAYAANRSTIGTNICLGNGNIIVGSVTLKKGAMLGHLSMLGVGVRLGANAEIGVGCMVGLKTDIGENSSIDPGCVISHKVKIGNNSKIGADSFIGNEVIIGDNLTIPSNTSIPDKAEVYSQEDVIKYVKLAQVPPTSMMQYSAME